MTDKKYNLTLFEACEILSKSQRTLSRYVNRGLLHPVKVKSQRGTVEYRFSKEDLENFRVSHQTGLDETRQVMPDVTIITQDKASDTTTDIEDRSNISPTDILLKKNNLESETEPVNIPVDTADKKDTPDESPAKQDRAPDTTTDKTSQDKADNQLIPGVIDVLTKQLGVKDKQIETRDKQITELIERDKESNYIIGSLQEKLKLLGSGVSNKDQEKMEKSKKKERDKNKPIEFVEKKDKKVKDKKATKKKEQQKPKKKKKWGIFGR